MDCLFGFTGRPFDPAIGLQNNLNRWYDPATGNWLSQDPTGFTAGDTNLYRYCGNSPTNAVDPSGLLVPPWDANAHWVWPFSYWNKSAPEPAPSAEWAHDMAPIVIQGIHEAACESVHMPAAPVDVAIGALEAATDIATKIALRNKINELASDCLLNPGNYTQQQRDRIQALVEKAKRAAEEELSP